MRKFLIVDVIALAVYAVVSWPALTGIAVHEWVGLAVFVVFAVHVAQHYDWVVSALRAARKNPAIEHTGRLVLDVLIAITLMIVVVSGIMVSGSVLPTFGYYAEGYYFWDPLHAVSAKVLLALLLVHVVINAALALRLHKQGRSASGGSTRGVAKAARMSAQADELNAASAPGASNADDADGADADGTNGADGESGADNADGGSGVDAAAKATS